jgi:hypothetical protein
MLFALRLWLGEHIYGVIGNPKFPAGYRISSKRVVKWPCEAPELDRHHFALANTQLPIPQIYSARTWRGRHAITMEYIPHCKTVQECWHTLSSEEKQGIVLQVSGYIQRLHSLSPPPELSSRVSATKGGACRDVQISSSKLFGPFENVAEFRHCVRGGVESDGVLEIFGEKVANIHNRPYTVRFTHGDLGLQNVLVRGGKVVAIIDWECSDGILNTGNIQKHTTIAFFCQNSMRCCVGISHDMTRNWLQSVHFGAISISPSMQTIGMNKKQFLCA